MADHHLDQRAARELPPLQGPGAFVGNLAMGLLFGWLFARTGRLLPFLVAHFAIDAVAFVGYPWAAAAWPSLFGLPG